MKKNHYLEKLYNSKKPFIIYKNIFVQTKIRVSINDQLFGMANMYNLDKLLQMDLEPKVEKLL